MYLLQLNIVTFEIVIPKVVSKSEIYVLLFEALFASILKIILPKKFRCVHNKIKITN